MAGRKKTERKGGKKRTSRFPLDLATFYQLVNTVNIETNKGDALLLTTESYDPERQNRLTGLTELIVSRHPPQKHMTLGENTVASWIDKQRRLVKKHNEANPHDKLQKLDRVTNSNVKTDEEIEAEKAQRKKEKDQKWRDMVMANIPRRSAD